MNPWFSLGRLRVADAPTSAASRFQEFLCELGLSEYEERQVAVFIRPTLSLERLKSRNLTWKLELIT